MQAGILNDLPKFSRYIVFSLKSGGNPAISLETLSHQVDGESTVVGLGQTLLKAMGKTIPGLRDLPVSTGPGISIPSTPASLWLWLRGDDRGELLHRSRHYEQLLSDAFVVEDVLDTFQYLDSRDLSGYIDGTENPQDDDAVNAAIVQDQGEGMDGSSFVAVQQWLHDLDQFQSMSTAEQDNTIGRRIADNEEIDEAPKSAHVKRTAQEDFEPEAFVVRRSMPWTNGQQSGLQFIAFGHSFDAFEALLNRMIGNEDGIVDSLFNFTHPVNGYYFWCPPVKDKRLDLSMLK